MISSKDLNQANNCLLTCGSIKNHPAHRKKMPSRDLIGIPKKIICTCGASRLAIPRKTSAIKIATKEGAASCKEIAIIECSIVKAFAQRGVLSVKKLVLNQVEGGKI